MSKLVYSTEIDVACREKLLNPFKKQRLGTAFWETKLPTNPMSQDISTGDAPELITADVWTSSETCCLRFGAQMFIAFHMLPGEAAAPFPVSTDTKSISVSTRKGSLQSRLSASFIHRFNDLLMWWSPLLDVSPQMQGPYLIDLLKFLAKQANAKIGKGLE